MRFNYSYNEFMDVIRNNSQFSFIELPSKFMRDTDHGCSFCTRTPNSRATLYFHNFDLNTSYHLQFSIIERMILSFDLYKKPELVKNYIENGLKLKFNQEVYDHIQKGYDQYINQIDSYIKHRSGKYRTVLSMNLRICFDKETHEYLGYAMNIHTHLIYHKKKGNLSPIIHFSIDGFKDSITYRVEFPWFTDRKITCREFINCIPDEMSVLQQWIGRCNGDDSSTFEEAMDGLDRIEMAVTIKEMVEI